MKHFIQQFSAWALSVALIFTPITSSYAGKRATLPKDDPIFQKPLTARQLERLEGLNNDLKKGALQISRGELSPYAFEQEWDKYSPQFTPIEQKVGSEFFKNLRKRMQDFPPFLESRFRRDLESALNNPNGPLLRDYLTYYENLLTPFGYLRHLMLLQKKLPSLRQQGRLPLPSKEYATLRTRIEKSVVRLSSTLSEEDIRKGNEERKARVPTFKEESPSSSFVKKGLNYVSNNKLQVFNATLLASLPFTGAISATNLNQNLNYLEDSTTPPPYSPSSSYYLQPIVISNCNGTCTASLYFNSIMYNGSYGNLGYSPGHFASQSNANVTIQFGGIGDQYIQGNMSSVNNWLTSVYFIPKAHYDQNTTALFQVWDSVTTPGTGPSGTINLNAIRISDPPVMEMNYLTISQGGIADLTSTDIIAQSIDVFPSELIYYITGMQHIRFFRKLYPAINITNFSGDDLSNGVIQCQHDGSEFLPSYNISAFDGDEMSLPLAVIVAFTRIMGTTSSNTAANLSSSAPSNLLENILVPISAATVASAITAIACWLKTKFGRSSKDPSPATVENGKSPNTVEMNNVKTGGSATVQSADPSKDPNQYASVVLRSSSTQAGHQYNNIPPTEQSPPTTQNAGPYNNVNPVLNNVSTERPETQQYENIPTLQNQRYENVDAVHNQ